MQISPLAQQVLKLVFRATSAQESLTRPRLERRSGLAREALNRTLEELARLGLLDQHRLRLTLPGLALAVACGARKREAPRSASLRAPLPRSLRAPIPLFSGREATRAVA